MSRLARKSCPESPTERKSRLNVVERRDFGLKCVRRRSWQDDEDYIEDLLDENRNLKKRIRTLHQSLIAQKVSDVAFGFSSADKEESAPLLTPRFPFLKGVHEFVETVLRSPKAYRVQDVVAEIRQTLYGGWDFVSGSGNISLTLQEIPAAPFYLRERNCTEAEFSGLNLIGKSCVGYINEKDLLQYANPSPAGEDGGAGDPATTPKLVEINAADLNQKTLEKFKNDAFRALEGFWDPYYRGLGLRQKFRAEPQKLMLYRRGYEDPNPRPVHEAAASSGYVGSVLYFVNRKFDGGDVTVTHPPTGDSCVATAQTHAFVGMMRDCSLAVDKVHYGAQAALLLHMYEILPKGDSSYSSDGYAKGSATMQVATSYSLPDSVATDVVDGVNDLLEEYSYVGICLRELYPNTEGVTLKGRDALLWSLFAGFKRTLIPCVMRVRTGNHRGSDLPCVYPLYEMPQIRTGSGFEFIDEGTNEGVVVFPTEDQASGATVFKKLIPKIYDDDRGEEMYVTTCLVLADVESYSDVE